MWAVVASHWNQAHVKHRQKTALAPPATATIPVKSAWHLTQKSTPDVLEVSLNPGAGEGGVEAFVWAERCLVRSITGLCAVVPMRYPQVVWGRWQGSCCSVVGG